MKQIVFFLSLISFSFYAQAQNGLERIIVEKYYVSGANDSASVPGGKLPVGSVTYRIYADMLPGYKFQAAFGIPGHELRLQTTTRFFNNEDKGAVVANAIPNRNLSDNTVMLDSWLSVGAAAEGNFGILKEEDDTVGTVIHKGAFLNNDNPQAGIAVKIRDGLIAGNPQQVTAFGIDSIIHVFNNRSTDSLFSTFNGSWACLNGAMGPDSIDNKVLIAQITTDGVFSFELNIQIGKPGGGFERYVARNPVENEIQLSSLVYRSEPLKTASPRVKPVKKG